MSRSAPITATILCLLVVACGGDSSEDPFGPNSAGTFQATLSGATSASISGAALFYSIEGEGFVLSLSGTGGEMIAVYRTGAGRPGTGTHSVGDGSSNGVAYAGGYANGVTFASTSGTLTITRSTTGALEGTIQFSGQSVDDGAALTANVTFKASCQFGTVTCN
jgi:hypothetical protein